MQDLKHLSRRKHSTGSGFFSFGRGNRKIERSGEGPSPRLSLPKGKNREQLKRLLLFVAIVLALIPVYRLVFQRSPSVPGEVHSLGTTESASVAKPPEAPGKTPVSSFVTACSLLDDASGPSDQLSARTLEGELLHYTIRGDLQKRVHDFLVKSQVPYGVFVAVEPATGRILALTAHSSVDPGWSKTAYFDLYPMASLFKIITASAALESKKITPETVIEFRGKATSENPRYWEASPKGRNNRTDVTFAMSKSINPVYGRLARDVAGKTSVMESVNRFGFNQALLPGTSVKESTATEPQSGHELMLMGAGLDHDVKVSPLHAAVMMAAIANGGRMMAPTLTDSIIDRKGASKETFVPREIRRLVTPETAVSLTRMLSRTVTSGTSRRAFHDRRGRPRLAVEIAAKTGSISGTDPRGHYSWFAAFAPANNPRIALVALVINQDKWRIKSSQVGEQALEEFFGN
ncbi:MAG: penicillin-binding protein [Desulfuromonadales bacterium]|nr:penicillin-binding protein [Desulfuromonadales bacterium]